MCSVGCQLPSGLLFRHLRKPVRRHLRPASLSAGLPGHAGRSCQRRPAAAASSFTPLISCNLVHDIAQCLPVPACSSELRSRCAVLSSSACRCSILSPDSAGVGFQQGCCFVQAVLLHLYNNANTPSTGQCLDTAYTGCNTCLGYDLECRGSRRYLPHGYRRRAPWRSLPWIQHVRFSEYFSPNSAIAPVFLASSMFMTSVTTGRFAWISLFTRCFYLLRSLLLSWLRNA